jgi:hypothetical protein
MTIQPYLFFEGHAEEAAERGCKQSETRPANFFRACDLTPPAKGEHMTAPDRIGSAASKNFLQGRRRQHMPHRR